MSTAVAYFRRRFWPACGTAFDSESRTGSRLLVSRVLSRHAVPDARSHLISPLVPPGLTNGGGDVGAVTSKVCGRLAWWRANRGVRPQVLDASPDGSQPLLGARMGGLAR